MATEQQTLDAAQAADDAAAAAMFEEFSAAKTPDAVPEPIVPDPTPTPAAATPVAAAAAPAAPSPVAPVQSDVWANATPEQKAAYEAAKGWEQKYNSDLGRNRVYQARIGELTAENADLKTKVKPTATPSPSSAAPAAPSETPKTLREDPRYKQLLDDYPDLMGPVVDALESLRNETAEMKGSMSGLNQDRTNRAISANEAALASAIPDWKQLTSQPDFFVWLGGRSQATQEIAARNGNAIVNAEEAIDIIGNYRDHVQAQQRLVPTAPASVPPTNIATLRQAQLDSSRAAPSRTPITPADGPAGGDTDALFNHFAAKRKAN